MADSPPGFRPATLLAILLTGLILRGFVVAVAPLASDLGSSLALTTAEVGLLTSLPILCFALVTPLASQIIRLVGPDRALAVMMLVVAAGIGIRSLGTFEALLVGVVMIGAAITIGNIVVPVLIRRDVDSNHVATTVSLYAASMNTGSVLTTFLMAPVAAVVGWQLALFSSIAVVAAASIAWLCAQRHLERAADPGRPRATVGPRARVWGDAQAGILAVAFAGQTVGYFGLTAWLPTILGGELGTEPISSAAYATVFQASGIAGALCFGSLQRRTSLGSALTAIGLLLVVMPLGLLAAPSLWPVWSFLGGLGQGAAGAAVFMLIVVLAQNDDHARRLTAMTQACAYGAGALAPVAFGALFDTTGSWAPTMWAAAAGGGLYLAGTVMIARKERQSFGIKGEH